MSELIEIDGLSADLQVVDDVVVIIETAEQGMAGPPGLNWINDGWALETVFAVLDAVPHNGSSYRCTAEHTAAAGTEPGVGATWATVWALVASKGDVDSGGVTNGQDTPEIFFGSYAELTAKYPTTIPTGLIFSDSSLPLATWDRWDGDEWKPMVTTGNIAFQELRPPSGGSVYNELIEKLPTRASLYATQSTNFTIQADMAGKTVPVDAVATATLPAWNGAGFENGFQCVLINTAATAVDITLSGTVVAVGTKINQKKAAVLSISGGTWRATGGLTT